MNRMDNCPDSIVLVLKDFHQIWKAKKHDIRKLRNMPNRLAKLADGKNLLIITLRSVLPLELKEDDGCFDCYRRLNGVKESSRDLYGFDKTFGQITYS